VNVQAKQEGKNKEDDEEEEETAVLGGCHCWGFLRMGVSRRRF
jgi:hypothetical protein